MPDEAGRSIKRKRIKLPGGDTIDIPVIYQITFGDPLDRGQETQITFDNSTDADRDVRVASIPGGGEPTDETGSGGKSGDLDQTLQVERIDKFRVVDAPSRGQETFAEPDSQTVAQPPDAPPYFTTHEKTHLVKYIKRNDDDSEDKETFIKSELIDILTFVDAPDRGQETKWILQNPPDNQAIDGLKFGTDESDNNITTISVNPDVEEITTGVGGSEDDDKPVRTDPFQNIIDFSGAIGVWIVMEGDSAINLDDADPSEDSPGTLAMPSITVHCSADALEWSTASHGPFVSGTFTNLPGGFGYNLATYLDGTFFTTCQRFTGQYGPPHLDIPPGGGPPTLIQGNAITDTLIAYSHDGLNWSKWFNSSEQIPQAQPPFNFTLDESSTADSSPPFVVTYSTGPGSSDHKSMDNPDLHPPLTGAGTGVGFLAIGDQTYLVGKGTAGYAGVGIRSDAATVKVVAIKLKKSKDDPSGFVADGTMQTIFTATTPFGFSMSFGVPFDKSAIHN